MEMDTWLKSNLLLLNQRKCEFLLFGSNSQLNKLDIDSISISGNNIPLSKSRRIFGVIFDSHKSCPCPKRLQAFAFQLAINCATADDPARVANESMVFIQ